MKQIYLGLDAMDASLVRDALEVAGIHAVLHDEGVGFRSVPFPSVWIEDADEMRARELLEQMGDRTMGGV